MYQAKDTIPGNYDEHKQRATDDLWFYNYNMYLTDILPKLKIISVDGRSSSKVKIDSADKGSDGSIYLGRKFESIKLTVNCRLVTSSVSDFNTHIDVMHSRLNCGEFNFTFHDERDWTRTGVVESIDVESGTLSPKIKINIYCASPFKTRDWFWSNGDLPLTEETRYSAWVELGIKEQNGLYQPQKIVIEYPLNSSVVSDGLLIQSYDENGKVIKQIKTLPHPEFQQNNKMEIYFKSDNGVYMYINGYPNNKYLDVSSNIADFGVSNNGYIKHNANDVSNAYAHCLIKGV